MQKYSPVFSFIIPFRYSADRIIPLRRVVDWLSGFHFGEVIIVEQDNVSKISHLNLKAKLIFTKSDIAFNKAWAWNVGLRRSLSDCVIFGEADIFMNPDDLIQSIKELEFNDFISPISNLIELNPSESMDDIRNLFKINRTGKNLGSNPCGITLFKKESIYKIGGWNEDFFGLDLNMESFQLMKMSKYLKGKSMSFNGYHLYHNPSRLDYGLMERNKKIIDFYSDVDINKINSHIYLTAPIIGQLNKLA